MPESHCHLGRKPRAAVRAAALLWSLMVGACGTAGPTEPEPGQTTVLFIGSSYLAFNDVPGLFGEFANKAGEDVFVRSNLLVGHDLDYFAAEVQTTRLLRERDWDFVVLQGGAQNAAYPGHSGPGSGGHALGPALSELKRNATELSPATVVVYMLPWAYEDGVLWVEGQTDDYAAMQLRIRSNALKWAGELDLRVAPVGMAFYEVLTQWDPPLHFLHDEDWNHASRNGSYLTAATIFSTVFPRSVTELSYDWELDQKLARDLRAVASRTVLDSLALWNIR